MTRPNFFIVGAPKCGTTALYEYLRPHPGIFMPRLKEPHYFADDLPGYRDIDSRDDYLRAFEDAGPEQTAVGEASVLYMFSRVALENIRQFDPDARIIAMVRNPVEMVHSLHSQLLYAYYEDQKGFEAAWRLQDRRARGLDVPATCREPILLQYREVCRLGSQVERLLATFPRDQVKLILFDDFKRSTAAVYRDVLEFLRVPDDGRTEFPRVNGNKRQRLDWLGSWMMSPPGFLRSARRRLKQSYSTGGWASQLVVAAGRLVVRMNSTSTVRQDLSTELRSELEQTFRDETELLSDLLHTDLNRAWAHRS